jgi:hypothetical protein
MLKPLCRSALSVMLLALACTSARGIEVPSEPRLDVYVTPGGEGYFALSLVPQGKLPQSNGCDTVIVFDTSASQTSVIRDKGLQALTTLLGSLRRGDRVHLFAGDLTAVALTSGFVSPQGDEINEAVARLKQRTPLGATDMPLVLRTAADAFDENATQARAMIYIGDGVSAANFMDQAGYRSLVKSLADRTIAVTSYAVGLQVDGQLLASLANLTGGMLAIDTDSIDPKQVGTFLASAVQGTVLWPAEVHWPKGFAEIYPERVPPLRSDRDTIVLGKGKLSGEQKIEMTARTGGASHQMTWMVAAGESNADYAFLTPIVDAAHGDRGLSLTTVGTPGLNETHRMLDESVQTLGKLAAQAVSAGNVDAAERLVDEALRRDPNDPTASAIKEQVAKLRAPQAAAAQPQQKREVKRFTNEQAAPPTKAEAAKYRRPSDEPAAAPSADDAQGLFLEQVDQQRRLITSQVRAEVENELRVARRQMQTDPVGVQQGMKLLLERVMKTPQLSAEVRAQLRGQLEMALREASSRAFTKDILDQQAQEARAAALDRLRIADALVRNEEKAKQLMDRFTSLMDEGRYAEADRIGSVEMPKVAPDTPITANASLVAHLSGAYADNVAYRMARQKGVIDTLRPVELALIPFPDDQPVVYPDAEVWQELTYRRPKYVYKDLKRVAPAEARISEELKKETSIDFQETPLQGVVDYLKDLHRIEIQLDEKALTDAGIDLETQVTKSIKGISLRSALKLVLGAYGLTYLIKDEVLLITTTDQAQTELVTKAYPVADLVIPIRSGGGMGGGMMGGMGGGMMGGMGGGMGGMGGGMGGMGGGMGGMGGGMGGMGGGMGGMGGGMFNVADDVTPAPARPADLKLGPKTKVTAPPAAKAPATSAKAAQAGTAQPVKSQSVDGKPAAKPQVIKLTVSEGVDPLVAWNDYFAAHRDVNPQDVRETVRHLKNQRSFAQIIGLIHAALRNGMPQPWMYEGLALAVQANGGSKDELERALMSALDFADNAEDFMYAAQYMARCGLESRALKVFRQVSMIEPLRPEPYLYGLQLAQRASDTEGIQWSSLGILRQAWPKDKAEIVQNASRAAAAAVTTLKAANRVEEAEQFQAEIDKAKIRDCIVKVNWTGDADVDVLVQEPSGSVCSFRSPRSSGGGVLLGDASASRDTRGSADGLSETYVCPEAFNGTYRVLIRRVWGKVATGKVTVEVVSKYGTKDEKHLRHQIALGDEDQMVVFDLKDGRRDQPLEQHQLANAAATQVAVNQAILAQQIGGLSNSSGAAGNLGVSRGGLLGIPFVQQAVGYQPVIVPLPSGTQMFVSGVVSADRRYVRVSPSPFFTGVSSVTTFNIQSGATSQQSGVSGGTGSQPPGGNPGGGGF